MRASHHIHHFFLPKEKNNFKARVLHIRMLAAYMLFFLGTGLIISQVNVRNDNVLGYATDITVEKLLTLTNEERKKEGLEPLTFNDKLAVAASKKADDMFTQNYWAHYAPDGTTPWSFILGSGYKYEYAGENLAKNFLFSDGVVEAWMKSPTHRENLLRKEYKEVGFAVANGVLNGEETTLVVQMFGTPLDGITQAQGPKESAQVKQVEAAEINSDQTAVPKYSVSSNGSAKILSEGAPSKPSFSKVIFNGNVMFIAFLIVAFLLDMFVAIKLNIIHLRVGGKTIIHIMFLGFVLIGILIIANGRIL